MIKKNYYIFKILIAIFSFLIIQKANLFAETKEKTIIQSDRLKKEDEDIIEATGSVEIKRGNKLFNADHVEYNQRTKVIKANPNVRVLDKDLNNIYFAEKAEINEDLTYGRFNNAVLLFDNGSNITSPHIQKNEYDTIKLKNTSYSVCPTDIYNENISYEDMDKYLKEEKTPLFSLDSSTVDANTENRELKLWGTSVWIWKIPIFYIPYFKTGLSFQNELDGFGTPGVEYSNNYNYGIYIPYKITTDNLKIVLKPKIYQEGNYLLNTRLSLNPTRKDKETQKWSLSFIGDIVNDNDVSKNFKNSLDITEKNEGKYKKIRGYASLNGYYNFNEDWIFDYNSAILSDRYFYRDYYNDNISYIQSNFRLTYVDINNNDNFNYFQFSNVFFQELLESNDSYNTPRYAPISNFNIQDNILNAGNHNLYYNVKINTTDLFRVEGIQYNRFTLIPSLKYTNKSIFGVIHSSAELKSDFYILDELKNYTYKKYNNNLIPQFNIEWRKNFILSNFSLQPIIKYSVSQHSNKLENDIPNEDSYPTGITFENIFSNNRFVGYDRQEFGNRITYGIESNLYNLNFGIAQGYRDEINENDPKLIGFENNTSDYVGYASYIFNQYFNTYYRFLLDKDDLHLKKQDVNLNFNTQDYSLYVIYTDMDTDLIYKDSRRQINFGISINFLEHWIIENSNIFELWNDIRWLESKAYLIYNGDCTRWNLSFSAQNGITEVNQGISFNFNFIIKFL